MRMGGEAKKGKKKRKKKSRLEWSASLQRTAENHQDARGITLWSNNHHLLHGFDSSYSMVVPPYASALRHHPSVVLLFRNEKGPPKWEENLFGPRSGPRIHQRKEEKPGGIATRMMAACGRAASANVRVQSCKRWNMSCYYYIDCKLCMFCASGTAYPLPCCACGVFTFWKGIHSMQTLVVFEVKLDLFEVVE